MVHIEYVGDTATVFGLDSSRSMWGGSLYRIYCAGALISAKILGIAWHKIICNSKSDISHILMCAFGGSCAFARGGGVALLVKGVGMVYFLHRQANQSDRRTQLKQAVDTMDMWASDNFEFCTCAITVLPTN